MARKASEQMKVVGGVEGEIEKDEAENAQRSMEQLSLNEMTLPELRELQVRVNRTIANYEETRRREALDALHMVAREKGFALSELLGSHGIVSTGKTPRRTTPVAPKYRNPHNQLDTWSGRGRKPAWFIVALGQGKTAEDLAI